MTGKEAIRERIWDRLEADGIARFPFPPSGRITNFEGADETARRAMATDELSTADAVKANPDAPQLPLRRRLLRDGTSVYMAVPRLADRAPFVELDPDRIHDYDAAATISKMETHGERVSAGSVGELDAIVVGSVAVTERGERIGKGEGYSDLEYAILRELGLLTGDTPVVTTVHDVQVVDDEIETRPHDVPVDVICTPTRTVRTGGGPTPEGVFWELLSEERIDEIPVLDALR